MPARRPHQNRLLSFPEASEDGTEKSGPTPRQTVQDGPVVAAQEELQTLVARSDPPLAEGSSGAASGLGSL